MDHDRDLVDLVVVIGTSLKVAPVSEVVGILPKNVPQLYISREVVLLYPSSGGDWLSSALRACWFRRWYAWWLRYHCHRIVPTCRMGLAAWDDRQGWYHWRQATGRLWISIFFQGCQSIACGVGISMVSSLIPKNCFRWASQDLQRRWYHDLGGAFLLSLLTGYLDDCPCFILCFQ